MRYILLILAILVIGGCNRPKTIKDDDMQKILEEIFLANAYCNINGITCDTLDIYRPILAKYNYKPEDMSHTINSFTKRKSSRFSDVINSAIDRLAAQHTIYQRRVAILDTVDLIAGDRYKEILRKDSVIKINSFKDTAKLRIKLPAEPGLYKITFNYQFDSLDRNYGWRSTVNIYDSTNTSRVNNSTWLRSYNREKAEITIEVPENNKELRVQLVTYNRNATEPKVLIDSLRIVYYLPKKIALDSLNKHLLNYKLLIDGKEFHRATKDSSSLATYPPNATAITTKPATLPKQTKPTKPTRSASTLPKTTKGGDSNGR